jgi:hypothetical protein
MSSSLDIDIDSMWHYMALCWFYNLWYEWLCLWFMIGWVHTQMYNQIHKVVKGCLPILSNHINTFRKWLILSFYKFCQINYKAYSRKPNGEVGALSISLKMKSESGWGCNKRLSSSLSSHFIPDILPSSSQITSTSYFVSLDIFVQKIEQSTPQV